MQWIKSILPKATSAAFLEPNNSEGQEVMTTEVSEFSEAGIKAVAKLLYPPNTTDFTPYLTKIAALHPSVFVPSVASPDKITQVKLGIELGVAADYEVVLSPAELKASVPATFSGRILETEIGPQFDVPTTAKARAFIIGLNSFLDGKLPANPGYSPYYYDSTFMLVKAMEAAGSVSDTEAIAKQLSTLKYDGMYGDLSYNGGHKIDYPIDNCIYQTGELSCENMTLTSDHRLEVLGSAAEKIR